jgi:tetratricopeptide (TPR) repeat protein
MIDDELKSRYFKDIEYYGSKIKRDPNTKVYMPLAYAYLVLEKYDETVDICEKGLEKHPDYMPLAVLLGEAFLKKGMIEEAKTILESVLGNSLLNFKAPKLLGDIYKAEDRLDEALKYYKIAHNRCPENNEIKLLLKELQKGEEEVIDAGSVDESLKKSLDANIDNVMDHLFKNMEVEPKEKVVSNNVQNSFLTDTEINDVLLDGSLHTFKDIVDKSNNIENLIEDHNVTQKNKKKLILNRLNKIIDNIEVRRKIGLQ